MHPGDNIVLILKRLFFLPLLFVLISCSGSRSVISRSKAFESDNGKARVSFLDKKFLSETMVPIIKKDNKIIYIDKFESSSMGDDLFLGVQRANPVGSVSWEEANESCNSIGKRLCTASEWVRACIGVSGNIYSYGTQYKEGVCNVSMSEPTANNGYFELCHSDAGVHDLIGNQGEWVLDGKRVKKYIMGGKSANPENVDCFSSQLASPTSKSSLIGFRCCMEISN